MKKNTAARTKAYKTFSIIVITLLAISFAFPLYWIITGSFKTGAAINATTPEWWPSEWVTANYQKLFSRQVAPLWEIHIPFTSLSLAGSTGSGSDPLVTEYGFHGSSGNASDLLYSSHGRICTCKEKIYRTYDPLFSDRMCDGSSETGYFNPVIT